MGCFRNEAKACDLSRTPYRLASSYCRQCGSLLEINGQFADNYMFSSVLVAVYRAAWCPVSDYALTVNYMVINGEHNSPVAHVLVILFGSFGGGALQN